MLYVGINKKWNGLELALELNGEASDYYFLSSPGWGGILWLRVFWEL